MRSEKADAIKILESMLLEIIDRGDPELAQSKVADKLKGIAAALRLYDLPKRLRRMSPAKCRSVQEDPAIICRFGWIQGEDPRMERALVNIAKKGRAADTQFDCFMAVREVLERFGPTLLGAVATIIHARLLIKGRGHNTKDYRIKTLGEQLIHAKRKGVVDEICCWLFHRVASDDGSPSCFLN